MGDAHKKTIWMLIVLTVNVPRNCDPVHLDSYGNTKMSLWKNALIATLNLQPTSEMTSENKTMWQSIVASDQVEIHGEKWQNVERLMCKDKYLNQQFICDWWSM